MLSLIFLNQEMYRKARSLENVTVKCAKTWVIIPLEAQYLCYLQYLTVQEFSTCSNLRPVSEDHPFSLKMKH